MGYPVNGAALQVGDVVWDEAMTGDNHPVLVVARSPWQFTVRNCTSNLNGALELVLIQKADKTGDFSWSGKDSYVVKSGPGYMLETAQVIGQQPTGFLEPQPQMAPTTFYGPDGPTTMFVPTGYMVMMPQMMPVYGPLQYTKVGTVKPARMNQIAADLA